MLNEKHRKWLKAAPIPAIAACAVVFTAQAAIAGIGAATALGGVDWTLTISTAILAGIVSILTSVAGLPEVKE